MANPKKSESQLADRNGRPMIAAAQATIAAVDATAATSSTPFGYSEAQANEVVTQLNLVIAALKAHGLVKDA